MSTQIGIGALKERMISVMIAPVTLSPTALNSPYPLAPNPVKDVEFATIIASIPLPANAPATCAITYPIKSFRLSLPVMNTASETAGLT